MFASPPLAWAQKFGFTNPIAVGLPLQAGSASDVAVRYVTNAMGTRKEPDRVTCSSGGVGSPQQHLAAEMFNACAGVKLSPTLLVDVRL